MKVLVDAMGGDNAPGDIVKGSIDAIREKEGFDVVLIGDETQINEILKKENFSNERLTIKHTTEVILSDDAPTKAIRYKKDSSMVVGFSMIRKKREMFFYRQATAEH